ncbi:hypothetical protein HPP92_020193 [Vanilla planifolia]|uniref:Uncharacterized protein n=1 Tax=Vanilla planifolia TaxID=51239 RepID=A0A835UI90_VANPL|nr:hypothetical protein HPP92_020193 [Vanilla planifolia]
MVTGFDSLAIIFYIIERLLWRRENVEIFKSVHGCRSFIGTITLNQTSNIIYKTKILFIDTIEKLVQNECMINVGSMGIKYSCEHNGAVLEDKIQVAWKETKSIVGVNAFNRKIRFNGEILCFS